jgi:predicted esterase
VYQFYNGTGGDVAGMVPWREAMDAPGASEMKYAKHLLQSRPAASGRVPDQSLIVGSTLGGSDHVQAMRAGDRSYALVYSASGQSFKVDLTKVSGTSVKASWFSPRDGSTQDAGTFAESSAQTFTPPTSGYGQDWVLVLDDADQGYITGAGHIPRAADLDGSTTGSVTDGKMTLPYRLFAPTGVAAGQKVPLVLFLHGAGDRGTDNVMQTEWMGGLINATQGGPYAAYVLAPQIDKNSWFQSFSSTPTEAMALTIKALKYVMATQDIDTTRIYVTGNSMGGMGTWDIMYREPNLIAAAVPMSGGADLKTAPVIKDIPVWAFHGSADDIVPVSDTRNTIQALRDAGGNPKYTEVPGGKHTIWEPIYDDYTHTLYSWLFSQVKANPVAAGAAVTGVRVTGAAKPVVKVAPKPVAKPVVKAAVAKAVAPAAAAATTFSVTPVAAKKETALVKGKVEAVFNAPAGGPKKVAVVARKK